MARMNLLCPFHVILQYAQKRDDCLGIIFNSDYWIIDSARSDDSILSGSERVMISIDGVVQNVDYVRTGSAIVIWRKDNPDFNPMGKVMSITTPYGKGEFTL